MLKKVVSSLLSEGDIIHFRPFNNLFTSKRCMVKKACKSIHMSI